MIRKTTREDIPRLVEIYTCARAFMRRTGNPNQWPDTYPGPADVETDIANDESFVLYDENGIYGTFYFRAGTDPTYSYIEDGAWIDDTLPYGTIHRIASDGSRPGVLAEVVKFCEQIVPNLRVDTHEDNTVMQNAVKKQGFKRCGIIYLENGEPRIAFQRI